MDTRTPLLSMARIEQLFQRVITSIYIRILKKEPSEKVGHFFKNFSYLALAEIIGSVIGFPIKILVGRFLGPEEYGKYSLVIKISWNNEDYFESK
jgi:hypothetical protein